MSERELRELERLWHQTRGHCEAAALTAARLRCGELERNPVEHAARLGFGPALDALGLPAPDVLNSSLLDALLLTRNVISQPLTRWLAIAFAERTLALWATLHPGDKTLEHSLNVARGIAAGADPGAGDEAALFLDATIRQLPLEQSQHMARAVFAASLGNAIQAAAKAREAAASFVRGTAHDHADWSLHPGANEFLWQHDLVGQVLCELVTLPVPVPQLQLRDAGGIAQLKAALRGDTAADVVYIAALLNHEASLALINQGQAVFRSTPRALAPRANAIPPPLLEGALGLQPFPGGPSARRRLLMLWSCDCVARVIPLVLASRPGAEVLNRAVLAVRRFWTSGSAWTAGLKLAREGVNDYTLEAPLPRSLSLAYEAVEHLVSRAPEAARRSAAEVWQAWVREQGLAKIAELPVPQLHHADASLTAEAWYEQRQERTWQGNRLCDYLLALPEAPQAPSLRSFVRASLESPVLRVTRGLDAGKALVLRDRAAFLIGRAPNSELQLHDPYVSRLHATVRSQGQTWTIENHSQTNTYILGEPIPHEWALPPWLPVEIGQTELVLQASERTP